MTPPELEGGWRYHSPPPPQEKPKEEPTRWMIELVLDDGLSRISTRVVDERLSAHEVLNRFVKTLGYASMEAFSDEVKLYRLAKIETDDHGNWTRVLFRAKERV